MRLNSAFTSASRRALIQLSSELRLYHQFSTARIAFNSQPTGNATQLTPETKLETTTQETRSEQQVNQNHDPASINYLLHKQIIQKPVHTALERLGYHKLTAVQEKSIEPVVTTDSDFIMKAKTGTGKTLAFGIPLIEAVLSAKHYQGTVAVVVAPTRDLAFQIRDELNKIVQYKEVQKHTKYNLNVQTIVGGEKRYDQVRAFKSRQRAVPSIVVATPGRLLDVMTEPAVEDALAELEIIVLDEADRLLGDGFKEDLLEITQNLKEIKSRNSNPRNKTPVKTMLYSATLDKQILDFSNNILRPGFKYIDTVDPNAPETHEKIEQSLVLTDNIFESYVSTALFIESESKRTKNFKAIVFLPTVKSVTYFYEILSNRLRHKHFRLPVHQLHGQLSQSTRDRSVKEFRKGFSGVLVASDVGARGMDFPNVTNVIQIGLPMDSTNYVHRVGRTARGGKTGNAVMILTKAESRFLRVLKNRGLKIASQFEYEKSEEDELEISELSQQVRHKYTLDLVIESLAGFSKGVINTYRLNLYDILSELKEAYGRFYNDESRLPHVTHAFATRVLGLNKRDARDFFDLEGTQQKSEGSSYEDGESSRGYQRRDNNRGQYGTDPTTEIP
ncbi:hypothetical protein BON22_3322 [Cyberlindnera fabianii]|uniref:ATP-dependent RNA helicase n=1 Tax=Cyberlindnera fabianii TaxID=36022 RepID=A0A1V2L581_CYBFA|nr:hypothetical protein BON22_3322 [Cyberlindnera fabianii]